MKSAQGVARTPRSTRSGQLAAALAGALSDAGVETIYGIPGGGNNLDVVGAAQDAGTRFILTHGEAAAAIMAAVDGELMSHPGACLVTRGPGAVSAANGVAHALLDRAPLAVIADDVSLADRRRISHQFVDQAALFGPITKWSGRIGLDGASETIASALAFAMSPAAGPIHLMLDPDAPRPAPPTPTRPPAPPPLGDAVRLLRDSRRPVVALGVGARNYIPSLRELLADKPWPVLTTYKAKGAIPESWPNAAGLLTGATREADVLWAADLIIAIGLDPVELIPAPWPYPAPVVALAEWASSHPYFTPRAELVGPLADLIPVVGETLRADFDGDPSDRESRLHADRRLHEIPSIGIGPQDVVLAARAAAPAGTIATVDSGAHMLVAMPLWDVEDVDEVLISSGLATMGFALPAAIAAAIARPGRRVICFTGDGGLGMTLAELETIARLALPITVVVFNDGALSLIEIKQRPRGQGGPEAVRYRPTDFAAAAASMGLAARRVETREELRPALVEAHAGTDPVLLDVAVDASGYREVIAAIRGGSYERSASGPREART